jgi:hypothetical protein
MSSTILHGQAKEKLSFNRSTQHGALHAGPIEPIKPTGTPPSLKLVSLAGAGRLGAIVTDYF